MICRVCGKLTTRWFVLCYDCYIKECKEKSAIAHSKTKWRRLRYPRCPCGAMPLDTAKKRFHHCEKKKSA